MNAAERLLGPAGEPLVRHESAGAILSPDGRYRYLLWRRADWESATTVLFVMLNPSTADGEHDDPTIRRCLGYARAWGYGWLEVCNLFAWRATDPRALLREAAADADLDLIGPDNDAYLELAARRARVIVCAWGVGRQRWYRARQVAALLRRAHPELHALRVNAAGQPCHPLYLPASLAPTPWGDPEYRHRHYSPPPSSPPRYWRPNSGAAMGICAKCGRPFNWRDLLVVCGGRTWHYVVCPKVTT